LIDSSDSFELIITYLASPKTKNQYKKALNLNMKFKSRGIFKKF